MFFLQGKMSLVGTFWLAVTILMVSPTQGGTIPDNLISRIPVATNAVARSAGFDGTNFLVGLEYNIDGTANQIDTHVGAQMLSSTGTPIGKPQ